MRPFGQEGCDGFVYAPARSKLSALLSRLLKLITYIATRAIIWHHQHLNAQFSHRPHGFLNTPLLANMALKHDQVVSVKFSVKHQKSSFNGQTKPILPEVEITIYVHIAQNAWHKQICAWNIYNNYHSKTVCRWDLSSAAVQKRFGHSL